MRTFGIVVGFAGIVISAAVTGCSASAESTSNAGVGALSEADCTPRADQAEADDLEACTENHTFDYEGCTDPAYQTYEEYLNEKDVVYASVASLVDPITLGCKKNIAKLSCNDLLTAAGDGFAVAKAASQKTKVDPKLCAAIRSQRALACDSDASDALEEALHDNDEYVQLVNQSLSQWASFRYEVGKCWVSSVASEVGAGLCTTHAATVRTSAYLSCRGTCPDVTASSCTPEGYTADGRSACGTLSKDTGYFGLTCESGATCARTSVCDDLDAAQERVKDMSCVDANGLTGILQAEVKLDTKGGLSYPTGVTTKCASSSATSI